MAVTEQLYGQSAAMLLNDGTTASGAIKTVKVNIGTLSSRAADWNAQKALNIINAVSSCLERSVYSSTRTANFYLIDE